MSGVCYAERRAALRWPLVMWGLGLPAALVTVFTLLGILVNPDWFIAVAFTPLFLPVMMGISLLYRNWPTGIRVDERGVAIGAVGSRRAPVRRPTVTHQNWGLFSCAWRDISDLEVVTDSDRLAEIRKSAEYWTLSNRWGKPRQMTRCMTGVLTAPFMKAALVIDVGYAGVTSPQLRSALFFANWIGAPRLADRLRAEPSPVWVAPTLTRGTFSPARDAGRPCVVVSAEDLTRVRDLIGQGCTLTGLLAFLRANPAVKLTPFNFNEDSQRGVRDSDGQGQGADRLVRRVNGADCRYR